MNSSSEIDPTKPLVYISLTSFIDYATATDPQQRLTVVHRVKKQMQEDYSPAKDTYKVPREAIQQAKGSKVDLASLPTSTKRDKHWKIVVEGYNKFIGRKDFTPKPIKRKEWIYEDLVVGVNPEIALSYQGITVYYKLYFKSESLTKRAAHTIYQMMFEMLELNLNEDIGIIDLRKGKVVAQPSKLPDPDIAALLRADAAGFVTLWNNLL